MVVWLDEAPVEAGPARREPAPVASDGDPLAQIKVWLLGVSPMVWRRVLVPADCTLRELHGVFRPAGDAEAGW